MGKGKQSFVVKNTTNNWACGIRRFLSWDFVHFEDARLPTPPASDQKKRPAMAERMFFQRLCTSYCVRTGALHSAAPQAARLHIRFPVLPYRAEPASLGFVSGMRVRARSIPQPRWRAPASHPRPRSSLPKTNRRICFGEERQRRERAFPLAGEANDTELAATWQTRASRAAQAPPVEKRVFRQTQNARFRLESGILGEAGRSDPCARAWGEKGISCAALSIARTIAVPDDFSVVRLVGSPLGGDAEHPGGGTDPDAFSQPAQALVRHQLRHKSAGGRAALA